MTKITSIELGDHFDAFIAKKIDDGSYRNVTDLIHEGLRKVEEDLKLKALRKILDKGMQDIKQDRIVKNFSYESLMQKIDDRIESRNS